MDYWKKFTNFLESICEYVEDKFTKCVGEKNSKIIGDFFLLSFLVSKPQNNQNQYQSMSTHENPCIVNDTQL